MDGNPIDDLIKTNQKLSGITFTPEEIEEMKSSYQGNPELAFQDMVNTVQKARNIKFSYKERLDMKAQYGVPMAWVDIMALSENPELKTGLKNKAGESSAAGLWQVTSVHEPNIRKMFGVSHSDFIKDANKQERYVKEKLEPEYDKNLSEFRDTVEEGVKEGKFKDYEKYMVNGRFTDDQIKAMNHLLGSSGARYFFNNGTFTGTEPDRKARDAKRTLQQMVGLRKQYGVPTSLQDQYNFGDVVKQAAEEVTAATTPTLGGGQASVQKGPKIAGQSTDIDWGAGTVTTKFDKKQIKAEAKKKTAPTTPQGQPQFGVGRSVVDLQVTDKGESIQNADEVFKSGAPNERKIKENAWVKNTAKAKEITSDFSQYKDKKVDPNNLNDEELKLRDEIQQKLTAEKEVLNSSQYMLKDKYGANVEKDIQDLLSNQSAVIDDISNLEKTIKDKYQGKTPSNADIAPLTKQRAELGDNIRDLVVQQNALNAKAEELNNNLKEFGERPGVTEEEYNRYYNEINKEFVNISNQFDALNTDIGRLNQDYEKIRLQEQSLIEKYNEEASNINSQYAADSDVQKLKTKLGEYNKNLGRIQKYQEDPFFNSYLDSLYNITDLGKSYKNLFPDVLEGEERSKELAKLARDIVKKEKTEYWSPQNIFIDLYNGVKSLYTDAPATGVFSTLLNSLKTASYNIAGDFIGAAASLSDLAGAEDVARKLRVGDLYGANVTRMNIEQDVTRGAVRSDIQGNTVEKYYTVKETDDELFSTGLQPGDRVILEEGIPVSYRGADGFKKDLNLIPGTNPDKVVENFVKGKPTKDDYSVNSVIRTVTSSLPSIIDMASLIGFNYAAIPRISRLFAKAGARSAAGLAANFGMQTFQQYGDLYSSYLQKGLSPGDAAKYALGQSAGVALIELFNPLEMKVASLGGDAAVNSFRKIIDTSVDLFARGEIGRKDLLANIGIGAATALKEAGIEGATELIQGEFENIVENYATNGNKSTSMNDSLNTLATTLAVVLLPSISMGRAAYRNAKSDVITSSIFKAAQNKEQFLKDLDKAVTEGKLEISEAVGIKNYVEYIKDELDEYGNITDNQGAALTGLIGTRYYYENKKKNSTNETAKKEIDKKIEEINKTIQDVVSGAKKPEVDPFVAEFVGEKGKDKEAPAKEDINTKKAYDFDDTLFDNKTGKLTKLGEDVKKRIEAGEDIVIVTARGENQTQQIQDVLGIGADKIEATGDEAKKPEALQKRGISPQEYYDENQEKLAAIQGKAAPSQAAAGIRKEQQAELDKVNKRAERIQRTLQEDAAVQEEGDEPLLTAEQKKILETELQTLNQRRDAIQKQSTAEVPIQPRAEGGQEVGGQVQAKSKGPAGKGKGKEAKAEEEVAAPALKDVKSTAKALKGKTEGLLTEPTTEQLAKDSKDKNLVTYNFDKESDIPDAFKDKISSRGKVNGKKVIRVTLPKSMADYLLAKDDPQAIAEAYHKAKKDGSNPALVEAVGGLLGAAPTPTTTTTEKVAPEAGKAPQKANTVQGFELTKKDGTKAAPAEYRKNEKGNWGKVNAKGGVTPVSSAAQVAELENALSSQAAAEGKAAPTTQQEDRQGRETATPPMETVLEQIGSTKAKITDQIYRFFTKAAAQNDAEAKEMAKLTFAIWERVGQYFGGKNGTDWIKSKIQSLGRTSATQAGKLGEVRLQSPTVQAAELAEAAERVANNIVEHIDSLIAKGRKVLAAEKDKAERKRIQQSLQSLKDTKEQVQKARKDPRFQVDAYHGTPYVFDKFTTEKIGTGEGAQAFGWGLYFTDLESIARNYAKVVSKQKSEIGWEDYATISEKKILQNKPSENDFENIRNKTLIKLKKSIKTDTFYGPKHFENLVTQLESENYNNYKYKAKSKPSRNLYKISLFKGKKPIDYTLLEWDKPLSKEFINKMIDGDIDLTVQEALLNYYGEGGVYDITTVQELKETIENEELTGQELYNILSLNTEEATPKSASIALLNAGIAGIKYPAESISRGATADTARGFNYVIFDENDVAINERVQFQQEAAEFRAATIALANNKFIVAALENPNASSFVHEEFHTFEDSLSAAERQTLLDSYNENFGEKETEWTTDVSEWGGRLWEKYFSNGRKLTEAEVKDKATRTKLQEIFDKFTEYLKGIYDGVIQYTNSKGATKEVNISPEVQALFDKIMGITPTAAETKNKAETKTAEQLSEDIQASIEAETAKEQEAMAKAFEGNKKQTAANDLIKNPKSAQTLPQDLLEELYNLAAEAKYTPALKKKCD